MDSTPLSLTTVFSTTSRRKRIFEIIYDKDPVTSTINDGTASKKSKVTTQSHLTSHFKWVKKTLHTKGPLGVFPVDVWGIILSFMTSRHDARSLKLSNKQMKTLVEQFFDHSWCHNQALLQNACAGNEGEVMRLLADPRVNPRDVSIPHRKVIGGDWEKQMRDRIVRASNIFITRHLNIIKILADSERVKPITYDDMLAACMRRNEGAVGYLAGLMPPERKALLACARYNDEACFEAVLCAWSAQMKAIFDTRALTEIFIELSGRRFEIMALYHKFFPEIGQTEDDRRLIDWYDGPFSVIVNQDPIDVRKLQLISTAIPYTDEELCPLLLSAADKFIYYKSKRDTVLQIYPQLVAFPCVNNRDYGLLNSLMMQAVIRRDVDVLTSLVEKDDEYSLSCDINNHEDNLSEARREVIRYIWSNHWCGSYETALIQSPVIPKKDPKYSLLNEECVVHGVKYMCEFKHSMVREAARGLFAGSLKFLSLVFQYTSNFFHSGHQLLLDVLDIYEEHQAKDTSGESRKGIVEPTVDVEALCNIAYDKGGIGLGDRMKKLANSMHY